uniref:CN hydrolase domain-containing protein n=1 Tax=Triticum urartu TaxID=4572 RepID=A0A8R7QWL3_TRIUA
KIEYTHHHIAAAAPQPDLRRLRLRPLLRHGSRYWLATLLSPLVLRRPASPLIVQPPDADAPLRQLALYSSPSRRRRRPATQRRRPTPAASRPAPRDKAEKLTAETAGYGSQLVLFPEVFVGGYPHGSAFGLTVGSRSAKGKEDFWKYHTAAINVPERTAVRPGGSSIISPSMAVLAGPNYEGEALLTADQDIGEIVRAKFDFDAVGNYKRAEVPSLSVNTDAVGHCKRA